MKRVYLSVCILILIPVCIIFGQLYLRNSTSSMSEILKNAEASANSGDIEKAEKQLDSFKDQWEKNQKIMATFIRHSELDPVYQNASKLTPYLENGEKTDFCAECEEIRAQLEHIYNMERFTLDNFF